MDRVTLTEEDKEAILLALEEEKPMRTAKFTLKAALIAACLCVALAVTALAASPGLREALEGALGSFLPYSQEVDGVLAVDQGIEIKVVSSLMDEDDGTAYLEVKDLKGDRLSMDTRLRIDLGRRKLAPIAYDPETKTALFAVNLRMLLNEIHEGRMDTLTFTCEEIYPGRVELPAEEEMVTAPNGTYYHEKGIVIPKRLFTKKTLKTFSVSEDGREYVVLKPNQTPADIGSEYCSVSSIGFDEEGSLHVQLAMADGVYLSDESDLSVDAYQFMWYEDFPELDNGIRYRTVLLEGGRYLDINFVDIQPKMIDHMMDGSITGTVYTQPPIKGNWKLTIPLEPLSVKEIELHDAPFVWENTLMSVELTAMSMKLHTKIPTTGYFSVFPTHLFYGDGKVMEIDFDDGWGGAREQDTMAWVWRYPQAVDPEEVTGFSFGLWYVSLEEGSVGQEHWLPELP